MLKNLALTICGKISICVNSRIPLGKNVLRLVDFLIQKNLVAKIFHRFLSDQVLHFERKAESGCKEEPKLEDAGSAPDQSPPRPLIDNNLRETLYRVLNISDKAEKYTKKHFGYSLLDLKGDFVWADKNTCLLLDLTKSHFDDQNKVNLFDLMIPMSKRYLHLKFGEELFGASKEVGASKCFSYVIYSRSTMQTCLRTFKKMNVEDPDSALLNDQSNRDREVFTRYLKAVSSRASLIMLSFNRAEIQSLLNSDKCQMQISKQICEQIQPKGDQFMSQKLQIYKLFIFLETRLATSTPNFDFSLMRTEPQILLFEQNMREALKHFSRKQGKLFREASAGVPKSEERVETRENKDEREEEPRRRAEPVRGELRKSRRIKKLGRIVNKNLKFLGEDLDAHESSTFFIESNQKKTYHQKKRLRNMRRKMAKIE